MLGAWVTINALMPQLMRNHGRYGMNRPRSLVDPRRVPQVNVAQGLARSKVSGKMIDKLVAGINPVPTVGS